MDMIPQVASNQRDRIGKGRQGFDIPSRATHPACPLLDQQMGDQRHDRIETQQRRGTAGNRLIIPLPLRFQPQMGTGFFKRDFHRPALDKPIQDGLGRVVQVGREQSLRIKLLLGIANEDPADGHRRFAAVRPNRGIRADIDVAGPLAIAVGNAQRRPLGLRIVEDGLQGGTPIAFESRSAFLTG